MRKILVLGLTFAVILSLSFGCGCIGDVPDGEPVLVVNTIPVVNTTSVVNTTIVEEVQLEVCPIYEERDVFEQEKIFETEEVFESQPIYESCAVFEIRYDISAVVYTGFLNLETKKVGGTDFTASQRADFLTKLANYEVYTGSLKETSKEVVARHEDVLVGHEDVLVGHKEVLVGFRQVKVGTELLIVDYEEVPLGTCVKKEGATLTDEAQVRWEKQEIEDEDSIYPDFKEPEPTPTVEEKRNVHITVDYVAKKFIKIPGTFEYDWMDAPKTDKEIEEAVWVKAREIGEEKGATIVSLDIKIEDI